MSRPNQYSSEKRRKELEKKRKKEEKIQRKAELKNHPADENPDSAEGSKALEDQDKQGDETSGS